jgi:hypothetical protein
MPPRLRVEPRKFIRWFSIEGFVSIAVIVVSLILSLLSLYEVIELDTDKLIATNAAILSVLASLSIANAVKLIDQARFLQDLAEQTRRKDLPALVIKPRQERPSIEEFLQGAKRVLICDMFLSSVRLEQYLLVKLVESRCDVRIAVLNPNNENLLVSMANLSSLEPLDNLKHLLQAAITNVALVSQVYVYGATDDSAAVGTLQLGYSNEFMPFAGVLVETVDQQDHVLIELYPFKYDGLKVHRHHFVLEKKNTPDLFETYKESLERLFAGTEIQNLSESKLLEQALQGQRAGN